MPSVHGELTSYTIIVINLKIHNYALHNLIMNRLLVTDL